MRNDGWLQRWHIIWPGKFSLIDKRTASHVNDPALVSTLAPWRLRWELTYCAFVIYIRGTLYIPCAFHLLPCRNKGTGPVTLRGGPSLGVVAVKHIIVIRWGKLQCNAISSVSELSWSFQQNKSTTKKTQFCPTSTGIDHVPDALCHGPHRWDWEHERDSAMHWFPCLQHWPLHNPCKGKRKGERKLQWASPRKSGHFDSQQPPGDSRWYHPPRKERLPNPATNRVFITCGIQWAQSQQNINLPHTQHPRFPVTNGY
jgi:hypothetical protein